MRVCLAQVVGDLVKIFNYCCLEGPRGLFLTEISFVTLLGSWAYYRLYLLPSKVIYAGVLLGAREAAGGPDSLCMQSYDRAQQAGGDWWEGLSPWGRGARGPEWAARGFPAEWTRGDGSFNVWASIRQMPTHECLGLYWQMAALLLALQAMQIIWYALFLRILYRIVASPDESIHQTGRDVYEGDSDDEGGKAKPKAMSAGEQAAAAAAKPASGKASSPLARSKQD